MMDLDLVIAVDTTSAARLAGQRWAYRLGRSALFTGLALAVAMLGQSLVSDPTSFSARILQQA